MAVCSQEQQATAKTQAAPAAPTATNRWQGKARPSHARPGLARQTAATRAPHAAADTSYWLCHPSRGRSPAHGAAKLAQLVEIETSETASRCTFTCSKPF